MPLVVAPLGLSENLMSNHELLTGLFGDQRA